MKNTIILAACLLLPAAGAARAEDQHGGLSREQAAGIAGQLMMPVRQAVIPAVRKAETDLGDAMHTSNAASWALWDLLRGMSAAKAAAPEPDAELTETFIRLRMRCNTGDLCARDGTNCKAYPGDDLLARAAGAARGEIKSYAAGFRTAQDFTKAAHRRKIEGILETARKRVLFSLPRGAGNDPRAGAMTPSEEAYRRKALEKKRGAKYVLPPWP